MRRIVWSAGCEIERGCIFFQVTVAQLQQKRFVLRESEWRE
jgi:hypothetical protein